MNIISILKSKSNEVRNVKYLFILQLVDRITPLIVIPYLMVTLGAEKYGYIGFSSAVIQYLVLLTSFGFALSATQRIAVANHNGKEEISRIFFSTVIAQVSLLIVGTILGIIVILSFNKIKIYADTILCTYPMAVGTALSTTWFFQGIGKIRIPALVFCFSRMLILPLTFIFVKNSKDYNYAAIIQSFVYIISSVVNIILIIKLNIITKVRIAISDILHELKESYPLFLSTFATSAYTQLFTIILGFFSSSTVVGRYSAAEKIMRSLCFAIYSPISTAYYPKISSLAFEDKDCAKVLLLKLKHIILIVMICLSLCLLFFASPLTSILGNGYDGLTTLVRIISPTPIAIALGAIYGQMGLIAMGNYDSKKYFKQAYVIAAFFSIALVFILTYFYKEIGTAISLVLTEYFVFIMMYYYCRIKIFS
ncbi:oligosaccharide flippase family protein [Bacteroides togonis]|uniref:oligosaccharide flippase family protein n=1 Tax=Bacteroides togonis TaxID=1917883 RepID=UPI00094B2362|nr:oligosaccharide flippase family protein [Bacteroides togonis]